MDCTIRKNRGLRELLALLEEIRAAYPDTPIMADSIKTGGLALTIPEGMESEGAPYGFAIMNPENQELLDMFNAGLKNIKANGKYDEIIAEYLEK
ncbi:MAG: transporter substrate-binding domain-containing protein [Lachnospiraceae bacterium]|nr:transporter substrate-binding domain-containing protein [Lachnospiraceae bacterium]